MVDFNPPDPDPPEEEPSADEYAAMAEQQADHIDSTGHYVAEMRLINADARDRAAALKDFDPDAISIVERDEPCLVFRKSDPKEFILGIEVIAERLAGI